MKTRRVVLGVAALVLAAATTGCATVRDSVIAGVLGDLGDLGVSRQVVTSTYESVPRQYLWRPPVIGFGDRRQFRGWGGDCGFALRPLWMDDAIVLPAPEGGPLAAGPHRPLIGAVGRPLRGAIGDDVGTPFGTAPYGVFPGTLSGLLPPHAQFNRVNLLPPVRLSFSRCRGRQTFAAR